MQLAGADRPVYVGASGETWVAGMLQVGAHAPLPPQIPPGAKQLLADSHPRSELHLARDERRNALCQALPSCFFFPHPRQQKKSHMDDTKVAKPQGVGLRNGRGPFQKAFASALTLTSELMFKYLMPLL